MRADVVCMRIYRCVLYINMVSVNMYSFCHKFDLIFIPVIVKRLELWKAL